MPRKILVDQQTLPQQDLYQEEDDLLSPLQIQSGDIVSVTRGMLKGFYQAWAREPGDFFHYTNDYLRKIPAGFFEVLGIDGGSAVVCLRLNPKNEFNRDRWMVHVDDLRIDNGIHVVVPAVERKIKTASQKEVEYVNNELQFDSEEDAVQFLSDILQKKVEIDNVPLGLDQFGEYLMEVEKLLGRKLSHKEYEMFEKQLCPRNKE